MLLRVTIVNLAIVHFGSIVTLTWVPKKAFAEFFSCSFHYSSILKKRYDFFKKKPILKTKITEMTPCLQLGDHTHTKKNQVGIK